MRKITFLFILVYILLGLSAAFAVTIKLSGGGQISGDIVSENDKGITVKVPSGTFFLEKSMISSIIREEGEYFDIAENLVRDKLYKEALDKYNEFLSAYPSSGRIDECLGKIFDLYNKTGDYESFIRNLKIYYHNISGRGPNYERFISLVSEAYFNEKELSVYIKRFLDENPDLKDDFFKKVFLYAKQFGATAGLEKSCEAYSNLAADFSDTGYAEDIYFNQANLYLKGSKYDNAIITYNKLLKFFPETKYKEKVYFNLVEAYIKNGDTKNGIAIFRKAKELFPQSLLSGNIEFLIISKDESLSDEEKLNNLKNLLVKTDDGRVAHEILNIAKDSYLSKNDNKGYIKFVEDNLKYANSYTNIYFKYALCDAKLGYLKILIKNKTWDEYAKVKADYEKYIKDNLDLVIKSSKDKDLVTNSRYTLWLFSDMLHKVEEKDIFEDLRKDLEEIANNTDGIDEVKKLAEEFFKNSRYEYAKKLYLLYTDSLVQHLTGEGYIGRFKELVNELSSGPEFKKSIIKELVSRYVSALQKLGSYRAAIDSLMETARDYIKDGNCISAGAIEEVLIEKTPNLISDKDIYDLALCYEKENNYDEANILYGKISQLYPESSYGIEVGLKLARYWRDKDDYKRAIDSYKTILKSGNNDTLLNTAYDEIVPIICDYSEGELTDFLTDIMTRFKGKDIFVKAEYQMAYYYYTKNRFNDAQKLFNDIILNFSDSIYSEGAKAMLKLMG